VGTTLPLMIFLSLTGCSSECDDPSRINGTYAVYQAILNGGGDGAVPDPAWPAYEALVNGWTKWEVTWTTSGTVNLTITDANERQGDLSEINPPAQSYSGTLTADEASCNRLNLELAGTWNTSAEALTFSYTANLVFVGDHLGGTFTYEDTLSDGSPGITGAEGEFLGTLQTDGFDTGFSEG